MSQLKLRVTELMLLQLLGTNIMLGVRWIILVGKKNHSDIFSWLVKNMHVSLKSRLCKWQEFALLTLPSQLKASLLPQSNSLVVSTWYHVAFRIFFKPSLAFPAWYVVRLTIRLWWHWRGQRGKVDCSLSIFLSPTLFSRIFPF